MGFGCIWSLEEVVGIGRQGKTLSGRSEWVWVLYSDSVPRSIMPQMINLWTRVPSCICPTFHLIFVPPFIAYLSTASSCYVVGPWMGKILTYWDFQTSSPPPHYHTFDEQFYSHPKIIVKEISLQIACSKDCNIDAWWLSASNLGKITIFLCVRKSRLIYHLYVRSSLSSIAWERITSKL